jgi:hypothetical protein
MSFCFRVDIPFFTGLADNLFQGNRLRFRPGFSLRKTAIVGVKKALFKLL